MPPIRCASIARREGTRQKGGGAGRFAHRFYGPDGHGGPRGCRVGASSGGRCRCTHERGSPHVMGARETTRTAPKRVRPSRAPAPETRRPVRPWRRTLGAALKAGRTASHRFRNAPYRRGGRRCGCRRRGAEGPRGGAEVCLGSRAGRTPASATVEGTARRPTCKADPVPRAARTPGKAHAVLLGSKRSTFAQVLTDCRCGPSLTSPSIPLRERTGSARPGRRRSNTSPETLRHPYRSGRHL